MYGGNYPKPYLALTFNPNPYLGLGSKVKCTLVLAYLGLGSMVKCTLALAYLGLGSMVKCTLALAYLGLGSMVKCTLALAGDNSQVCKWRRFWKMCSVKKGVKGAIIRVMR